MSTPLIEEIRERRREESCLKRRLAHYIGAIARLEIEHICEERNDIRENNQRGLKLAENCLKTLENELGMNKDILYTKFVNKNQILIEEYKAMLEQKEPEIVYSGRKKAIIERSLAYLTKK